MVLSSLPGDAQDMMIEAMTTLGIYSAALSLYLLLFSNPIIFGVVVFIVIFMFGIREYRAHREVTTRIDQFIFLFYFFPIYTFFIS